MSCPKNKGVEGRHVVICWWIWPLESISSTFYAGIFCTKVCSKPNSKLRKAAQKTFVQTMHSLNVDEIDHWRFYFNNMLTCSFIHANCLGGKSQNFSSQIHTVVVTLGLKILLLLRVKEGFETNIFKCWC